MELNDLIMRPNLFIAGAPKCGTTTLCMLLSKHPDIYVPPVKEPHFYDTDIDIESFKINVRDLKKWAGSGGLEVGFYRTDAFYQSLYDRSINEKYRVDATPYYLHSKKAPYLIKQMSPGNTKILIILRNPVERAWSHYLMDIRIGKVRGDFESLMNGYEKSRSVPSYLELGFYNEAVSTYIDIFGKKNVKVIIYNNMKSDIEGMLSDVIDFIDLDEFENIDLSKRYNRARYPKFEKINYIANKLGLKRIISALLPRAMKKRVVDVLYSKKTPSMPEELKENLKNYYLNDIEKLEIRLNVSLQKWK